MALSIQPTSTGDLLVVATGSYNTGSPLSAVSDSAGNSYVSANARSTWASPQFDVVEIFYKANSNPGATSITIASVGSAQRDVWFIEVGDMDRVDPLDTVGAVSDAPATAIPSAPAVTPTIVPSFIVSVGDFEGSEDALDPSSAFMALPIEDGNDAALLTETSLGSYGAVWDDPSVSSYCASTAAFRPASM